MAKVVSAICQKGGSAKSTLLLHYAVEEIRNGKAVLIIDADYLQQTIAKTWLGLREADDVKVIACDPAKIRQAVEWVREEHPLLDLILIDTPGQDHPDTPRVVAVSDLVLVPVAPDSVAEIGAMGRTVEVIKKHGKAHDSLVVLSKADPKRNGFESADTVAARKGLVRYGLPIAGQAITYYKAYKDTMKTGQAVSEVRKTSKSIESASAEIAALVTEINRKLEG